MAFNMLLFISNAIQKNWAREILSEKKSESRTDSLGELARIHNYENSATEIDEKTLRAFFILSIMLFS